MGRYTPISRSKKISGRFVLIGSLCLATAVLIILVGPLIPLKKTSSVKQKVSLPVLSPNCRSVEEFKNLLNNSVIGMNASSTLPEFLGVFLWKRNENEPFIAYETAFGADSFYPSLTEDLNRLYLFKIESALLTNGFVRDELNTGKNGENFVPKGEFLYGYTRFSEHVAVRIEPYQSQSYRGTASQILISCAIADPKYDVLYSEILQSDVFRNIVSGPNGIQAMVFGIWGIHNNNILSIGYGSKDFGGGSGLWVYKRDGKWIELERGQDNPECESLENYGIEPGINCFDAKDQSHTKTR